MSVDSALLATVDEAISRTASGLAPWPDPDPHRSPLEEEYSRLLDPAKWRILGARAEAWSVALVGAGVAVIDQEAPVQWRSPPGPVVTSAFRLVPLAPTALPIVIARSRLATVEDAGVVLGVGDPSSCVAWFPHCGCDACDSGSHDELVGAGALQPPEGGGCACRANWLG